MSEDVIRNDVPPDLRPPCDTQKVCALRYVGKIGTAMEFTCAGCNKIWNLRMSQLGPCWQLTAYQWLPLQVTGTVH